MRVRMSNKGNALPETIRRISTVIDQSTRMLGEEEIDSQTRRRKIKTETMQQLNCRIQRLKLQKLQAQNQRGSKIPIDLTMMENVF